MRAPIRERVQQPTPSEVRQARKNAGLSQLQAAQLVAPTQSYRSWQSYEVDEGKSEARAIPLGIWELFLLLTDQHPTQHLTPSTVLSLP